MHAAITLINLARCALEGHLEEETDMNPSMHATKVKHIIMSHHI